MSEKKRIDKDVFGHITHSKFFRWRPTGWVWIFTWITLFFYTVLIAFSIADMLGLGVMHALLQVIYHGVLFLFFAIWSTVSYVLFRKELLLWDCAQAPVINVSAAFFNLLSTVFYLVWIAAYNPTDGTIVFKSGREDDYITFIASNAVSVAQYCVLLGLIAVMWAVSYYYTKHLEVVDTVINTLHVRTLKDVMKESVKARVGRMMPRDGIITNPTAALQEAATNAEFHSREDDVERGHHSGHKRRTHKKTHG